MEEIYLFAAVTLFEGSDGRVRIAALHGGAVRAKSKREAMGIAYAEVQEDDPQYLVKVVVQELGPVVAEWLKEAESAVD